MHDGVKAHKKNGFTIIELLIYLATLPAILILLVNFLFSLNETRGTAEAENEVEQNIQFSVERMVQAIHNATGVNGTPGASLSLAMASSTKNPTVFDVASGTLRVTEASGTPQALTSSLVNVDSLSFTAVNNPSPAAPSVQINITVSYSATSSLVASYSQNLSTTAALKQ